MGRFLSLLGALLVSGCVYGSGGPPPLKPLAEDQAQPAAALIEHVLAGYFPTLPAGSDVPTVCVSLAPRALEDGQKKALIARFPRLAPRERCKPSGAGHVDAITGERAELVQVYEFACASATSCSGWATVPGQPSARYGLRWQDGTWRFARDPRLLAE
jgi:hypothetical protein